MAWVRIVRHTYAYKRNPLFHRRVPAPITSTLKGFVISRWAIREPLRAELADNLATAALIGRLEDYWILQSDSRDQTHAQLQKEKRAVAKSLTGPRTAGDDAFCGDYSMLAEPWVALPNIRGSEYRTKTPHVCRCAFALTLHTAGTLGRSLNVAPRLLCDSAQRVD